MNLKTWIFLSNPIVDAMPNDLNRLILLGCRFYLREKNSFIFWAVNCLSWLLTAYSYNCLHYLKVEVCLILYFQLNRVTQTGKLEELTIKLKYQNSVEIDNAFPWNCVQILRNCHHSPVHLEIARLPVQYNFKILTATWDCAHFWCMH